jgi:outer membrane protein assembly factor BamB
MKINGHANVRYRGIGAPPVVATASAPLKMPNAPFVPAVRAGTQGLQSYSAADVLSGTLGRWLSGETDGPTGINRCLPKVRYAGIGEVCDRLYLEGKTASSAATVTKNGTVLVTASDMGSAALFSAKIDERGVFTRTGFVAGGIGASDGILVTRDGHVAYGNNYKLSWAALHEDGGFGVLGLRDHTANPAQINAKTVVSVQGNNLSAFAFDAGGQLKEVASIPHDGTYNWTDSVVVRGNLAVLVGRDTVRTFRFYGDHWRKVDSAPYGSGTTSSHPPFVAPDGSVVIAQRSGRIDTFELVGEGNLKPRGHIDLGSDIAGPPVPFGNHIVVTCQDGTVRTLGRLAGELVQVDSFPTSGAIYARPTITEDGVVLVGNVKGTLYALELTADGTLSKRAEKSLKHNITTPVAVTQDGFVLVGTNMSQLLALRDK